MEGVNTTNKCRGPEWIVRIEQCSKMENMERGREKARERERRNQKMPQRAVTHDDVATEEESRNFFVFLMHDF